MRYLKLKIKKYRLKIIAIIFWIVLWQLLSIWINNTIFLASPEQVLQSLLRLGLTGDFWLTVFSSTARIGSGFFLAVIIGNLLALVTSRFIIMKEITLVLMRVIKSVPVASFIIFALLWIKSKNLSILISFLMVIPIIYSNVLKGIETTDIKLLEMAKVFRISNTRKLRYIYLPSVIPYFVSACSIGLGFCWKSGIAAEVISLAEFSIGSRLYETKLTLETGELFAWTLVIVCISAMFEKLVMYLIRKVSDIITKAKAEE
jgi:NitT/TauT family transport system permease protein